MQPMGTLPNPTGLSPIEIKYQRLSPTSPKGYAKSLDLPVLAHLISLSDVSWRGGLPIVEVLVMIKQTDRQDALLSNLPAHPSPAAHDYGGKTGDNRTGVVLFGISYAKLKMMAMRRQL